MANTHLLHMKMQQVFTYKDRKTLVVFRTLKVKGQNTNILKRLKTAE